MIAVDTNVLARFYCDDPDDSEAKVQRPLARRLLLESPSVFVPLTVVLEFEWVLRGFYDLKPSQVGDVFEHLIGMPHVTVERWEACAKAIDLLRDGLDFSDALHWACSGNCESFFSFDDRKLARRAAKLGLQPPIRLPG
jgi:predicted nucleic-acid-binding protein